jgi:hypothetical protein
VSPGLSATGKTRRGVAAAAFPAPPGGNSAAAVANAALPMKCRLRMMSIRRLLKRQSNCRPRKQQPDRRRRGLMAR